MRQSRSNNRRRGSAYILLLTGSLVVVVAGVTAVRVTTANVQTQGARKQGDTSQRQAQAGLEFMAQRMANDPGGRFWRQSARFTESFPSPTGEPSTTIQVGIQELADDDLTNDISGDVELRVRATTGSFVRQVGVKLRPMMERMKCLELAVAARAIVNSGGDMQVNGGSSVQLGARVSTNPVIVDWTGLNATTGADYSADMAIANTMDDRLDQRVPDSRVIDQWAALGTRITLNADRLIEKEVFSPTSNPLGGGVNALGIYVIDAQSYTVTFQKVRVVGTLIVIGSGASKVQFAGSSCFEPASWDRPALLIDGGATFDMPADDLRELGNATNFNPAGAPFLGTTDSDIFDTYPSMIRGLVYVDGDVVVKQNLSIQGQLLSTGTVTYQGLVSVQYHPIEGTPLGFSFPTDIKMISGSMVRY